MSSNHVDISSVWKSLVAICVRVAEVQMRIFNAIVSSIKVFVSSAKHVCLQYQCSSPTQNVSSLAISVIVCSVIS